MGGKRQREDREGQERRNSSRGGDDGFVREEDGIAEIQH